MIEVKRPLFVFAGQSNMMGAAVYPASRQIFFENSYEYMHRAKRFGEVKILLRHTAKIRTFRIKVNWAVTHKIHIFVHQCAI